MKIEKKLHNRIIDTIKIVRSVLLVLLVASIFSCNKEEVKKENKKPEITGTPSSSVIAGEEYMFQPSATDADGDELTFRVSNPPNWVSFNEATGAFTGTPTEADVGTARGITISVTDGVASASLKVFNITVIPSNQPQVEIIIRTEENLHSPDDVTTLINRAVENGITIISVGAKQDEDTSIKSGAAFYNSAIAPIAAGYESFDVLADLIPKAHQAGIKVRAWLPQFHDQVAFDKNAAWQMMKLENGNVVPVSGKEYFVNPLHPDVQAYELSIIEEVLKNYDMDEIVLDWIRFDNYNMDVGDFTRTAYNNQFGYDPITINFATDNAKRTEWNDWREQGLANYFGKVRDLVNAIKPNVKLGVYVLSPEWREVGQNPSLFKDYIDNISPMAYYDDWGYSPDWVYRSGGILSTTYQKVGDVPIMPAFDTDYPLDVFEDIFDALEADYPTVYAISFFEYGEWNESKFNNLKNIRDNLGFPK